MLEPDNSRHNILRKVRTALGPNPEAAREPDLKAEVFVPLSGEDLSVIFAENFLKTKGVFYFCENGDDLKKQLKSVLFKRGYTKLVSGEPKIKKLLDSADIEYTDTDVKEADAGITFCESLIARTGSVIISSNNGGRTVSVFPPVHIILAETSQIVAELNIAFSDLQDKYQKNFPSMVSLVSGPSRTADIEKTLVLGAHGPKELLLFLLDDTIGNKTSSR